MQSTRRSLTIGVVLLVTFSYVSIFATAQSSSVDNHPTSDDPYMYFWGSENLDDCWNNFDNLSQGSASEGYGEILFPEGQDVVVDFSCELQTGFSEDFILELNETISVRMKFNIESGNCGGAECDLTLTLFRGDEEISQHTEPANSVNNGNDFTTNWDIVVSDSFQSWSKDTSTTITVSYSVPAQEGPQCENPIPVLDQDCSGSFRMYYSDEGGSPGDVVVEFPIFVSLLDSEANLGKTSFGPMFFIIPFIVVTILLGWVAYREDWVSKNESAEPFDISNSISNTLNTLNPVIWVPSAISLTKIGIVEWRKGGALTENKTRRVVTLCLMYFAQGLPWGFASVTFAAYLTANGTTVEEIAILFATVALPWTFKWIWGPVVDAVFIERYGPRRQWVLFAQTGMALTLGSLIFVDDLNEKIELVTRVLFVHNIFASLQDVATDALAVEILQPDEVAKVNGFMFAAKRGGIMVGGAGLGVLISLISISGVIATQLALLLLIALIPLTLIEKPGVQLFPWSKVDAIIIDSDSLENSESSVDDDSDTPWVVESEFNIAKNVGYSVSEQRISITAFFTIIGLIVWVIGFAIDVFTIDWSAGADVRKITNPISYISLSVAFLAFLFRYIMDYLGNEETHLPEVPNPFSVLTEGTKNTVARTSFYLVKAFSVRSAFIMIGLCLLADLYVFVAPITFDIFINGAGWSIEKYSGVVGGVVVFGAMIAQIIGGFLGDRYGTRRIAMVFFLLLAFANASLAFLEPVWTNDTLMTIYLIIQAFIGAIAWICIISLTMRLTWSKVGGTQFTAYMSLFNLSGVLAFSFTGRLLEIFDYSSAIYLGAVLTMLSVIMLIFIDEDETDRVLEGRIKDDEVWEEEDPDTDLGERPEWWNEDDLKPSTS